MIVELVYQVGKQLVLARRGVRQRTTDLICCT
jgi:hypothetical protein